MFGHALLWREKDCPTVLAVDVSSAKRILKPWKLTGNNLFGTVNMSSLTGVAEVKILSAVFAVLTFGSLCYMTSGIYFAGQQKGEDMLDLGGLLAFTFFVLWLLSAPRPPTDGKKEEM